MNKLNLLFASVAFELPFSCQGGIDTAVYLKINELINIVFFREPGNEPPFVEIDVLAKVVGGANVKNIAMPIAEYVGE